MQSITCENVALSYESNIVCENLNFTVNKGDYLCIVGENGSGKSTLIKALLGQKPVHSGKIIFNGFEKSNIGYLPQQTQVQRDFPASVFEVVLQGCLKKSNSPFFNREQKQMANDAILRLGINGIKNKSYRELSGGQQQRVLLCRALCAAKDLIVLDEPVSGLDFAATVKMYDIITELNKEDNVTAIMVSHDINSALKYCTHVLHIKHNSSFFGTRDEYLKSNYMSEYLGGKNL